MGTSSSVPSSYSEAVSSESWGREVRPRTGLPGSEDVRYEVTRLCAHKGAPWSGSESSEWERANDVGVTFRKSKALGPPRCWRLVNARNTGPNAPRSGASGREGRLGNARDIFGWLGGSLSPSEVIPLAAEYVEKGLRGPGEMDDSVTDCVINIEGGG